MVHKTDRVGMLYHSHHHSVATPSTWVRLIPCVAIMSGSSGCALTKTHVQPPSSPVTDGGKDLGHGRTIALETLRDDRTDKSRCGLKINTLHMETSSVVCDVPPPIWVSESLAKGLTAYGFNVVPNTSAPSALRLSGSVLQFFVQPTDTTFTYKIEADIATKLVLNTPSGRHAERTFYTKGSDTNVLGGFDSVFQEAANHATQRSVQAMVNAIADFIVRYPETSSPKTPVTVASIQRVSR
jgi:uncharacterized lipoprotein YajG